MYDFRPEQLSRMWMVHFFSYGTQVAFFRWEDIPWDNLAFPTTSWALWHHRLRHNSLRREIWRSESNPSGRQFTGQDNRRDGGAIGSIRANYNSGIIGGDPGAEGEGVPSSQRSGGGNGGERLESGGPVFSTPTRKGGLFWCPRRGLHLKDGWNLSTDS